MIAKGKGLVTLLGGLLLVAGVSVALAQEGEIRSGRAYGELRGSLLQQGWKPDASYGLKIANGAPLYHFPEVLCGPQICRAKWRDRAGQTRAIMLVRGHDGADHRVAPQQ